MSHLRPQHLPLLPPMLPPALPSNLSPDFTSNLSPDFTPDLPPSPPSNLPPVLPLPIPSFAPSSTPLPPQSPVQVAATRRNVAIAACERCRKRKVKCDANRPACSSCIIKDKECCYYTSDPSESRAQALKRRLQELEQRENSDSTLVGWIRQSDPEDTVQLVHRIRQSSDSYSIVRDVQHGTILLELSANAPMGPPGSSTIFPYSFSNDSEPSDGDY